MIRRYSAALLVALMAIGLMSACGKQEQTTDITPQVETESQIVNEDELIEETQEGEEEIMADIGMARPSVSGALSVKGTKLVDKAGNEVQLRGISSHGIAWFPEYINADCINELSGWGANVFRLAMYTHEYAGYCAGGDQEFLKQVVRDGVKYATDADMYVIVDWHVLNEGDPNVYKDQAKDFFAQMSAELAGNDNVIYEICNEPCFGTSWESIKSYANEIIPIIRANDPDAVIIVGTPNWSQYVNEAAADPITGYDNIMYTLHFYAATHKDDLRGTLEAAVNAGLPIFVSEYGICDASGNGALDIDEANKWIELLDKYNISYICWNLSNKDESSAIIKPDCGKTSGFSMDDLSGEGQWLYNLLSSKKDAN